MFLLYGSHFLSLCKFVSQHVTDLPLSDWLSSMVLPPVVLAGLSVLPSVALFGIVAVIVASVVPSMVLDRTALFFAVNSDKIYLS